MLPPELKAKAIRCARAGGMSLGRLIREALQSYLGPSQGSRREDPFFKDVSVFTGETPADLAGRHDQYLSGKKP
jgi:hypothetical protein